MKSGPATKERKVLPPRRGQQPLWIRNGVEKRPRVDVVCVLIGDGPLGLEVVDLPLDVGGRVVRLDGREVNAQYVGTGERVAGWGGY